MNKKQREMLEDRLMFAIATGTLEEVVSALDAGADPNTGDGYFDRPLSWAMFAKAWR